MVVFQCWGPHTLCRVGLTARWVLAMTSGLRWFTTVHSRKIKFPRSTLIQVFLHFPVPFDLLSTPTESHVSNNSRLTTGNAYTGNPPFLSWAWEPLTWNDGIRPSKWTFRGLNIVGSFLHKGRIRDVQILPQIYIPPSFLWWSLLSEVSKSHGKLSHLINEVRYFIPGKPIIFVSTRNTQA